MIKIKVCGITNLKDAKNAIAAGCDALGFVFYRKSPRYIAPDSAKEIIAQLPYAIKKVGVFVDEKKAEIERIARLCKLDMLQLHGKELPRFCSGLKKYKVIKALKVGQSFNRKKALSYAGCALLFDTLSKVKAGGTGSQFNWNLVRAFPKGRQKVFLSGGLNKDNVGQAIRIVRPDWVDASSSLEARPGIKSKGKVRAFIKAVKRATVDSKKF